MGGPYHHVSGAAEGDGEVGEVVVEDKKEDSENVEVDTEIEEIRQPRAARVPHTPTKVEWEITCCSKQTAGAGAPIVLVSELIARIM